MYPVFLRDLPNPFTGGTFDIRWYGVWMLVAVVSAIFIFTRRSKKMLGIGFDDIATLALLLLLGGFAGAKFLTIFTRFGEFIADPIVFLFGRSNISVTGGLIGGGVVLWLIGRRNKEIGFLGLADALALAIPLAQMFGRQGCNSAGCCYGKPTDGWWGVTFSHSDSVCGLKDVPLIPTQLLESGLNLLLFVGLILFEKFYKSRRQGATFLAYGLGYGAIRFTMDFLRADKQAFFYGLTTNQWAVLVGLILIALAWWKLLPKGRPALEAYTDPPTRYLFKSSRHSAERREEKRKQKQKK